MGIRKGIKRLENISHEEGIIEINLELGKENWKILSVYNRGGEERIIEKIRENVKENKGQLIIGGDFIARISEEGEILWDGIAGKRSSKDKVKNPQGERLIELIGEKGWGILNGNKEGDEEGQWTFEGTMGSSVIDYAITNAITWDKVSRIEIVSRADSDHLPIILELKK